MSTIDAAVVAATTSASGEVLVEHSRYPHLTTYEWDALHRLQDATGKAVLATLLLSGTETQQHEAAHEFMARELAEARQQAMTPVCPTGKKNDIVKLDVSTYTGEGAKRMALNRWFCEAVEGRQLSTEFARTHFLMSKLSGKAKQWTLGRRVADPFCFTTMDELKDDLRLAFEPPQDEAHQRSAFLSLKQGKLPMRDYIQHARHLVSCIVKNSIDITTQVHVFVTGMNAGFQRFYLTRKTPASLEEASAIALREDYSAAASHAFSYPTARNVNEPELMEIDAIESQSDGHRDFTASQSNRGRPRGNQSGSKPMLCIRCRKPGHRAAVCRAPAPVLAVIEATGDSVSRCLSPTGKKRGQPVGAGRPTERRGDTSSLVEEPPPSPAALYAQVYATTSSSDKRLIILSLHVAGARRPLRALLDSGATNNFVRADSLPLLPDDLQVCEGPGLMVVKYADGEPRSIPRRSVKFAFSFDDFRGSDEFLVIELGGSFDCVFGMPWLSRHQPDVDWLNRTVRPRDVDVGAVLACLRSSATKPWPHIAGMDPDSKALAAHEVSNGPSYVACSNATCAGSDPSERLSRSDAVEQRLSHDNNAVEQRLPHETDAVGQRLPRSDGLTRQWSPRSSTWWDPLRDDEDDGEVFTPSDPDTAKQRLTSPDRTSGPSDPSRRKRRMKKRRGRLGPRSSSDSSSEDDVDAEVINVIEYTARENRKNAFTKIIAETYHTKMQYKSGDDAATH